MAGRASVAIDEFKENSIVGIGFIANKKAAQANSVDEMRDLVAQEHPTATAGRVISWGSQLYRFYNKVHRGDRVLMYEPSTRLYHIGEVSSDAEYITGNEHPHRRKVRWLQTLSRDALSTGTRNTLGAILALFEVEGEAKEELKRRLAGEVREGVEKSLPVVEAERDIDELGEDIYERSQEFIKDAIVKLDWKQVQEIVAGLLRAMGYKTRVSPVGADRGKDIVASPDGLGLENPRIAVEVKHRPNAQIGAPEVRAFAGGLRNAKGVYVSTGGFSREAHYEAERAQEPVLLLDIDELSSLITQYYEEFDADTRALLPLRKMYWPIK